MRAMWHKDPDNPDQNAAGASMPSGTNTGIPQPAGKPPMPQQQYQAPPDSIERYEAAFASMQEEINALKADNVEMQRAERVSRYAAVLRHKREIDGYNIDVGKELHRCQDYSQEQFDGHIQLIEELGAGTRAPLGEGPMRHQANGNPNRNGQQQAPLTKEQMDYALKYQAQSDWKVSTQDAQTKAREVIPG